MVDYLALALTHGLLALAGWRLLWRDDLDRDTPPAADGAAEPDSTKQAPIRPKSELRTRA